MTSLYDILIIMALAVMAFPVWTVHI